MECLYHYCGNQKCFSILKSHTLRMSDIRKSNDYTEMQLFYPQLLGWIRKLYLEKPFYLKYENRENEEALDELLDLEYDMFESQFKDGSLSSFVICFSEKGNSLSQWRGYADNGKGCCLGFSFSHLKDYCKSTNELIRLEKVQYVSDGEITEILKTEALSVLEELKGLRQWIVENMTLDDNAPNTDGLLGFNFHGMLESIFIDSLKYKHEAFAEEKEWRMFFANRAYKNPEWVVGNRKDLGGPWGFSETIEMLQNRIEFNILDDDIVPFFPVSIVSSDSTFDFVNELWIGPKNRACEEDIVLFLKQNGYHNTEVKFSGITYC